MFNLTYTTPAHGPTLVQQLLGEEIPRDRSACCAMCQDMVAPLDRAFLTPIGLLCEECGEAYIYVLLATGGRG